MFGARFFRSRAMAPRLARFGVPILCAALLSSCIFGPPDTAKPSPTPSPSPSATLTRPRLELSTYQYALQTKGKIRVAIRLAGPPLADQRPTGYEGFEVDLAREIAKAIWGTNDDPDTHIEWILIFPAPVDVRPGSAPQTIAISTLNDNHADIALAGIVSSDDNKKLIDLSDTYLHTGQRLLVKKTNDLIKEVADVASGDQTVCAVKGSVWEQNLKRVTNDRAKILQLDTLDFCMQALASGAADAVTSDELVLFGLVFKDPNLKIVGKVFTDDLLGIGIKKSVSADRQGFRDFLNTALLTIVANRTWAALYQKHVTPLSGDKKQLPTD